MKTTSFLALTLILAAAGVSGCARSEAAATPRAAAANATAPRSITLTANDTMKFSATEIYARPGETLAVTLTNQGAVPKIAMAHNWVLVTPDVDLTAMTTEGMSSPGTSYIPASAAKRVLASTALLGPNESDTTVFTAPKAPGRYPFLCTFPGHMQVGMKGFLVVE